VYAATKGYLDKVSTSNITAAEAAILKHVDPAIYKVLRAKQKITPELNAHLQVGLRRTARLAGSLRTNAKANTDVLEDLAFGFAAAGGVTSWL